MSLLALAEHIERVITEEPPFTLTDGGLIKDGVHAEIDELRGLKTNAQEWLLNYEREQKEKTGISTLKVRFNNVFGYFIEVTNTHKDKVPLTYTRKQTTVNGERYITPELKEYEEKILTAEDKIAALEQKLFEEVRTSALNEMNALYAASDILSDIDVLSTFAEISFANHYTKPIFTEEGTLSITDGRHPVVEEGLKKFNDVFVPNTTVFLPNKEEVLLLTGPNMAGKSTYLRQNALIVMLAQMGCFVPAKEAHLSIRDAIFTRVGASDNVSRGQSTFMVEMQETAYILHHATKNSLVILDEVGRGTSTYDGLSLAWAILEHIHNHIGAHTLFATHYHELIEVVENLPKAKNYSMAVMENSTGVVFLRKVVPGGSPESYGIEVAKLAGIPREVIVKASEILGRLESDHTHTKVKKTKNTNQLSLFGDPQPIEKIVEVTRPHPMVEELKNLDINQMSPMAALLWLSEKRREVE